MIIVGDHAAFAVKRSAALQTSSQLQAADRNVVSDRRNWKTRYMSQIWDLVHAERKALIADLFELSEEQWETPSLCGGWSVHDVAAHLIDNARTTTPRLLVAMAKARFDFDRQNSNGVAAEKGSAPQQTLIGPTRSGRAPQRTTGPTGQPLGGRNRTRGRHSPPLGILRNYPPQAVQLAINYQARNGPSLRWRERTGPTCHSGRRGRGLQARDRIGNPRSTH